jgi:hypothetical protein
LAVTFMKRHGRSNTPRGSTSWRSPGLKAAAAPRSSISRMLSKRLARESFTREPAGPELS